MKKFWIVLLSIGLIAAFCMPAAAVDFKMKGMYFIQGFYENNRSLSKEQIPEWQFKKWVGTAVTFDPTIWEDVPAPYLPYLPPGTEVNGQALPNAFDEAGMVPGTDAIVPGGFHFTYINKDQYLKAKVKDAVKTSSMGYFAQRLRLEPTLKVVEGVNLNMRIDAMERVWGQESVGAETTYGHLGTRNKAGEQNIQFRRVWVDFLTPVGMVMAGYMADGAWGTDFGDTPTEGPEIVFVTKLGNVVLAAAYEKAIEGRLGNSTYQGLIDGLGLMGPLVGVDSTGTPAAGWVATDADKYCIGGGYLFPQGQFGVLYCRVNIDVARPLPIVGTDLWPVLGPVTGESKTWYNAYMAYLKATFGPVYVEGEYAYMAGKAVEWDEYLSAQDVDFVAQQYYLKAQFNFGAGYVGAQYAFSPGDDPNTTDKRESVLVAGYGQYQPCLILFEDWTNRWSGDLGNYAYGALGNGFTNAKLYQIFAGFTPTPKLAVKASYTWAYADVKPVLVTEMPLSNGQADPKGERFLNDDYGTEFDITATYKIYDNLEYMVGFAYLWTGDYFKGGSTSHQIDNDYLLMHQLTLNF